MTRIVAGTAGGRRLAVPPRGTRPTSERVREALFSAVDALLDLSSARVLDLYAGSGALGLEALSRGAASVTFVEADRNAVAVLRRNVATVGLPGTSVVSSKVLTFLSGEASPFDLVLADPPYDLDVSAEINALTGWTAPGALVVLEQSVRAAEPVWPAPLAALRTKKYGDTVLHWAEHPAE
ncbi:16S rRNA (guanine(966)-N(2))-methyltransferase RsmD [Kibdelosporangium persicum]|uniref:Ribosomal RNA small subunit methyltransferase D n=1 Tax=Kibdelosporangium persicum TaxID=2698649 RepID=A0ABX2FD27_9PSEU|nr:16S rRNA (guanine(966)-N(2))-methyltransferase RsmD [Kibdelosporangium persicum]NRN69264.1 Ribosomal RNA small subunit methyltransferase D [Kibdelosporangium persicum]